LSLRDEATAKTIAAMRPSAIKRCREQIQCRRLDLGASQRRTTAITRLDLFPAAGNFVQGSRIRLIGVV